MKLSLHSPIDRVKGVGKKYTQALNNGGIHTVFDILLHFPFHYLDFSRVSPKVGTEKDIYLIEVEKWSLTRVYRRRLTVLKLSARIGDQPVSVVFFNKQYLTEFFKMHKTAYIYGQFQLKDNRLECNTPMIFPVFPGTVPPVIPVYNRIGTLKSGHLKKIIDAALDALDGEMETLPAYCMEKYRFPPKTGAFEGIHRPKVYREDDIYRLKKRFIYDEFLYFQLELQYIRRNFINVARVHTYDVTPGIKNTIRERLPFRLTPDQEAACDAITGDLTGEFTMQRLLQGDVGSGKTIVAFISLSFAVHSGYQGAFLAPTEILAAQHYHNALSFFEPGTVELLTGSTPAKKRRDILARLKDGGVKVIFGTHALITETVTFQRLSMVVIDEQHRFGVSQRAALYYKGNAADLLVTTATPIPRTMLLSLYNDLAVSTIKTKPAGRLPIITHIHPLAQRDEFFRLLKKKLDEGEKAFIILPLIEPSEFFSELRSVEEETAYYISMFKGINVGVVTGRTPAAEKDETLKKLVRGDIRVLVATTVIEVGIDVKDAAIIVIENADRYGLSQLHQLRGRVGRGDNQSYCYLFPSGKITEKGKQRLRTITATNDGFEIAETDLKMRGGGIISGLRQSGRLDFRVGNLPDDLAVFKEARQDADVLLDEKNNPDKAVQGFLKQIDGKLNHINFS